MAITFRSIASTAYASRANTVVTPPAGIANDDILVAVIATGAAGSGAPHPTAVTPPAGFTLVDLTEVYDQSWFTIDCRVYWKRAASEAGSYTFTHLTASSQAFIVAYSGCVLGGSPVNAWSKNFQTVPIVAPLAKTSIALSITTTVANTELVYVAHDWVGSGTLTAPSGFAERLDSLLYVADRAFASAAATGDVSQANANGDNNPWAAFLVALRPGGSDVIAPSVPTGLVGFALSDSGVTPPPGTPMDIDSLPSCGIPFKVRVDVSGIAVNGTSTVAQLALKGMRAVCIVDPTGVNGSTTVAQLAAAGIRAACLVDENGNSVASPVTAADALRKAGIQPLAQLTINGVCGASTIPQLAARGLHYAALVDENGMVT